jgi:hypothetical protein
MRQSLVPMPNPDSERSEVLAAAEKATGVSIRDLVEHFESLGCDCELGSIQRWCGAEPLSLLRFANLPLIPLLNGLATGFSALDDPATLEVYRERNNDNWDGRHSAAGMVWHTFKTRHEYTAEQMVRAESRRLRMLRGKLLEEISAAKRTFVVWRTELPLADSDAFPVFQALRRRGPDATLLYVVPGKPVGLVEELVPGLLRGRIDHWLAEWRPDSERLSFAGWVAVLTNAWLLEQERPKETRAGFA